MDYNAAIAWLLGIPSGGVSSHAKRPSPITPEMRRDAEKMEAWRKSGRTFPKYQAFPNSGPKAT